MSFLEDYESSLAQIKARFVARQQCECLADAAIGDVPALRRRGAQLRRQHDDDVAALRRLVRRHFGRFDAAAVSSLVAFPARALAPQEAVLHRVWLGGPPPAAVCEAMRQWDVALRLTRQSVGRHYRSVLWAWDEAQLAGDTRFERACGPAAYVVGRFRAEGLQAPVEVGSLAALLPDLAGAHTALMGELHARGYYVNLSDIARQLVLKACGGIYMDADTIPGRTATIFLARPELPDYLGSAGPEGGSRPHVSWLNALDDENGFLVAKRDNPALDQVIVETGRMLAGLQGAVPHRDRRCDAAIEFGARLHAATYGAWRSHLGRSLLAYEEVARSHCVLHEGRPEARVIGLHGMRLEHDWLTHERVPLTAPERAARARCVAALAARGWRLEDPLQLEAFATPCHADEIPRPAYAPQLRTTAGNLHYYSFLSRDAELDRVNALFGAWLIARNARDLCRPDWWAPVRGDAPHARRPAALEALA